MRGAADDAVVIAASAAIDAIAGVGDGAGAGAGATNAGVKSTGAAGAAGAAYAVTDAGAGTVDAGTTGDCWYWLWGELFLVLQWELDVCDKEYIAHSHAHPCVELTIRTSFLYL